MAAIRVLLILILFAGVLATRAGAAPLADATTDYTHVSVYAERPAFVPGEATWFAIRLDVRPGWHVFWINPGDAGLPLSLDWMLPDGFEAGAVSHPAPQTIPVGPLASYAHEGAPIFLGPVTAPAAAAAGDNVSINLKAFWQTCEEICVPEEASFSFALPVVAQTAQGEDADLFSAARAVLPGAYDGAASFRRAGKSYELVVADWDGPVPADLFFYPEIEGLTNPPAVQTARLEDGDLILTMEPGWTDLDDDAPVRGVLVFDAGAGRNAFDVSAEPAPAIAGSAKVGNSEAQGLAARRGAGGLFLLAFLGGLILNAMPCVFPILFVKAASLAASAGHHHNVARFHGFLYGVGVVASFAAIGAALLILRAGGQELGWGFHLQSPLVVGLSAYVLFAVGLNLMGLFHVGESLAGSGEALTRKPGAAGSFFTGVLAVVVAAPCIGPLLTAPMGAALTQGLAISMLIFIVMALGLAAPYVLISFAPAVAKLLPRPGPWMVRFKQILAIPVFLAAFYFLWVFTRQTQAGALTAILFGFALIGLAAVLFERSKGDNGVAALLRAGSALALALSLGPVVTAKVAAAAPEAGPYGTIATEPYDLAALEAYRAQGTPVFVDFTADWCVTCQFNKLTVLKTGEVTEAFDDTGTVLMVADWTLRDPLITEALESFGAAGVPLYVYYGAGAEPLVLPQTLTKKGVIETLERR